VLTDALYIIIHYARSTILHYTVQGETWHQLNMLVVTLTLTEFIASRALFYNKLQ
jgi:hypothetical protein